MPLAIDPQKTADALRASEMQDVQPVSVTPYGFLARLLANKDALAITNPLTGNVQYNPERLGQFSRDEQVNTIAHELTHARQAQQASLWQRIMRVMSPDSLPYDQRPRELEAFQTERDRIAKYHQNLPDPLHPEQVDIALPRDRVAPNYGIANGYARTPLQGAITNR